MQINCEKRLVNYSLNINKDIVIKDGCSLNEHKRVTKIVDFRKVLREGVLCFLMKRSGLEI